MDKVKVSKEVAKALDEVLKNCTKENLLEIHFNKLSWQLERYSALNELSNWKMAQILINGYEVEETAEERLYQMYSKKRKLTEANKENKWENDAYANGIAYTLHELNIKIKGIND